MTKINQNTIDERIANIEKLMAKLSFSVASRHLTHLDSGYSSAVEILARDIYDCMVTGVHEGQDVIEMMTWEDLKFKPYHEVEWGEIGK